jgi:hypothetical protein
MAISATSFFLCIDNEGYPASLEPRKIYQALSDPASESRGFLRVIDESGEDYLYPARFFVPIQVPQEAERVFSAVR